ncbi:MAG: hypothetical protein CL681_27445 [Blastopirellula sp.]|nr:hypothetical protein [Blastopirellula sp.]
MSPSNPDDRVPDNPAEEVLGSTRSIQSFEGPDSLDIESAVFADTPSDPPSDPPLDQQKTVISRRPAAPSPMLSPLAAGRGLESETLEHFHLEEFVGGGGMGAVYRATDTLLSRQVAVKVIAGNQQDDETLRRFRNEAQNAARLDHPNIARVYHVGHDKGWHYIVFEFIRGVNIRELVEHKGPLPYEEAFSYTLQVAEALDHAFRRGVIHRDIKPSNVIVTPDGTAKLVDMGLARFSDMESSSNDLTASGVTLGTFDYISPEQARDPRAADVRSDIYSLGCTLFFMLTGQPPFPDGTVLQKLFSHSSDRPPDIRELRDDADAELAGIIQKTLAKRPTDRQQVPSELAGELLLLAKRWQLSIVGLKESLNVSRQRNKHAWWQAHLYWVVPLILLFTCIFAIERLSQADIAMPPLNLPPSEPVTAPNRPDEATTGTDAESPENRTGESDAPSDSSNVDMAPAATDENRETSSTANNTPATTPDENSSDETPEATDSSPDSEDAGDASATSPPDEATPTTPPRIVVSTPANWSDENDRVVESISEAFRLAAELPTVEEVVLAFDGPRSMNLLDVRLARTDGRSVRVVAADGMRPNLHFDLRDEQVMSQIQVERPAMMTLIGGDIRWQDIDFSWDLPESPFETRASWTLIRADHVNRLTFDRCTFTVRNADKIGSIHLFVSIFEVAGATMSKVMPERQANTQVDNRIELTNCIARGEACLMGGGEGVPFQLQWNNGFLATTEQLFHKYAGVGAMNAGDNTTMKIDLRNVTGVVGKSLCEVDWKNASDSLQLALRIEDCLLRCNEQDRVLVSMTSPNNDTSKESLFDFTANRCYLPYAEICWRLSGGELESPQDVTFSEAATQNPAWFDQLEPVTDVTWESVAPTLPNATHDWQANAFQLNEASLKKPGFLFADLPPLPGARAIPEDASETVDDAAASTP